MKMMKQLCAAVLGIGLNLGAYGSEIVRSAIASIGIGRKAVSQQTAAHARPVCSARKAVCAGYPLGIARRTCSRLARR